MRKWAHKEARALLMLGALAVVLMLLTSWSFRAGNVIAGSFRVDDMMICEELSGDLRPLPLAAGLTEGLSQVCFWFEFSRAREGDVLEIVWKFDGETIHRESFRLAETDGGRAFYLLREDGSPLPAGEYDVTLFCNGRERASEVFRIRPDDAGTDDEGSEEEDDDEAAEDTANVKEEAR